MYLFFFSFRTSSASEYSIIRDQNRQKQSLSKDLLGPMVVGPIISLDDWVPERPPKNPSLRVPSPELPPPPPTTIETIDPKFYNEDDPLPPPPVELLRHMRQLSEPDRKAGAANRRNSFAGSSTQIPLNRVQPLENLTPPTLPKKPMDKRASIAATTTSTKIPPPAAAKPTNNTASMRMPSHKVILNGRLEGVVSAGPSRLTDTRMSLRKRSHNAPVPLHELRQQQQYHQQVKLNNSVVVSPPPLKPRMSLAMPDLNNRPTIAVAQAR